MLDGMSNQGNTSAFQKAEVISLDVFSNFALQFVRVCPGSGVAFLIRKAFQNIQAEWVCLRVFCCGFVCGDFEGRAISTFNQVMQGRTKRTQLEGTLCDLIAVLAVFNFSNELETGRMRNGVQGV
jgi:hypothetical protein